MSQQTLRPRASTALTGTIHRGRFWSIVVHRRLLVVTLVLAALVILMGAIGMTMGRVSIPLPDVFRTVIGQEIDPTYTQVIHRIRLPRTLVGVLAGFALGISGAIFQSVSRNALGSPDVIGFTTGAATGAISQIVLFQAPANRVALGAILGGVLTAVVVYALSYKGGTGGGYRLVLTGIGVGAIMAALNNLLIIRGDLDNAITANLWMAGSLHAREWIHVYPVLIGVVVIVPIVLLLSRRLTLIEMGDDMARQLGVRVEPVRMAMVLCAVTLAALATGAAGPIAFVALAAPQIVRRLTLTRSLPVLSAGLMGAFILTFADMCTHMLPVHFNLPIGRATGIVGGIYLIWLLTRSKQV